MTDGSIGSPALWAGFLTLVALLLALDLGVFHREAHAVGRREAAGWSAVWIGLAVAFNGWVWAAFGAEKGIEFATGYLIEKALSVDNVFVFVVIFSALAVPAAYQHRVLFWGIVGALGMRAVFIFAGSAVLSRFHAAIYFFGFLLLVTGIKLAMQKQAAADPEKSWIVRLFRRFIPVTTAYEGQKFLVRRAGKLLATPLLIALVAIEATDVVFAVDSIPAIFAVTTDPFIVFTSNIFAILGLRSLYFLLGGAVTELRFLRVGLAAILVFVGGKMLISGYLTVPVLLSLAVIAAILAVSVALSLFFPGLREDAISQKI